jgi:hypothetical protein
MIILFKLFLLIVLVQLAVRHEPLQERPLLLAALYAIGNLVLDLSFVDVNVMVLALGLAVLALAWLYFATLARLAEAGPFWWLVLLLGLPIILI